MTTIAQLGFAIDSTSAATASENLDKLVDAGARAEATIADVGATSKAAGTALADLSAATATASTAQERANQVVAAAGISAKQYAQSLRLLPVQIHQAFDQLLYGTNPLIVIATQGPQISESFGGIGNAVKALGTLITPASVGFTALAAAVAAVGYAWHESSEQEDTFRRALITTGNAVGLTVEQVDALRDKIKDVGNVSSANAATALTTAISAGITTNIQQVAQLAAEMQKLAGIPIAQTIKEFASLGDDPVKGSEALQKAVAFLTPQLYDEIVALDKQGRTAEATAVAQQALIDKLGEMGGELKENQGLWDKLKSSLESGASDAALGIGKSLSSFGNFFSDLHDSVASIKDLFSVGANPGSQIAFLQQQLANSGAAQAAAEERARQAAKQAAAVKEAEQTTQLLPQSLASGFSAAQQAATLANTAASDAVQRSLQAELDATQRYDQLLDAEHSAHLLSDQAYYDAKRKAIAADTQDQVDALEKQIAILQQQNGSILQFARAFEEFHQGPAEAAQVTENWSKANSELHANNEKILDDQAKLNQLTADGAQKVKLLGIEQQGAAKAAKDAVDNLRASEEQYLETLQRNYDLQLKSLTAGPTEKQRLQDIAQIDAQYLQQRQQLDQAKRINPELPNYDEQLKVIEDAHQKALADTDAYYKALDVAQANWLTGAKAAYATYQESARNVAELSQNAFTDALTGIEDAFTNLATTGKLSFKSLADSMIADIGRIIAKMATSNIASLFGALLPNDFGASGFGSAADTLITSGFSLGPVGAAAGGGPISGPTIVGEEGPELFIPNTSGFVVPNDKLASLGGPGPVINFRPTYQIGSGVDRAQVLAAMDATHRRTIADMTRLIRGGAFKN